MKTRVHLNEILKTGKPGGIDQLERQCCLVYWCYIILLQVVK